MACGVGACHHGNVTCMHPCTMIMRGMWPGGGVGRCYHGNYDN